MRMFTKKLLSILLTLALIASLAVSAVPVYATNSSNEDSTLSLQGERIYQIMTDRFYDGDPSNNAAGEALRYQEVTAEDMSYMKGGDWQGIIDKIP